MEGPILAYLISLMLIFSSLPNTTSSKSLVKRAIYRDAMGVVSNYFDCRKNYYHKREIYATIREGCVLYKYKKKVQATCSSLNKCKEYPYEFKNTKRIKFVIKGPYFSYPLLKSGGLYKGGENKFLACFYNSTSGVWNS